MKKQTAVEWLELELKKLPFVDVVEVFQKAKAMEKEQIEDAYWHGGVYWHNEETEEQWYKKTYVGDK